MVKVLPKVVIQPRQDNLNEPITEITFPKQGIAAALDKQDAKYYKMGTCFAILGHMPDTGAYHMSVSTPNRYPTWDEIVKLRYALIPDNLTMAMMLPPKSEYINVHEYCFQLHEVEVNLGDRSDKQGYFISQTPSALR